MDNPLRNWDYAGISSLCRELNMPAGAEGAMMDALKGVDAAKLLEENNSSVRIELVKYGGWSELMDALNTGRVDGASVLIEMAMKAKEQGIPLKLELLGHRDGNVVITSNEIQSADELAGLHGAASGRSRNLRFLAGLGKPRQATRLSGAAFLRKARRQGEGVLEVRRAAVDNALRKKASRAGVEVAAISPTPAGNLSSLHLPPAAPCRLISSSALRANIARFFYALRRMG